jgi:hypothetical protein
MQKRLLLAVLLIPSQLISFMAFQPAAQADSWKDVDDLIELVKSTGTKVQKTGDCEGNTMGFYQPPRKDGTGDRLVFCTNNIDMEDVSAVWEVLSHESAHVMQACQGGLIWKEEFHPRMLRNLKSVAPHYYEVLQQYRGADKMIELEAFDMELKTADEVKNLFLDVCGNVGEEQPTGRSSYSEQEDDSESQANAINSILAIVGGEASFRALMDWAAQNLGVDELEALKRVLDSGDMEAIKETLALLQNIFNESKSYQNYRLF